MRDTIAWKGLLEVPKIWRDWRKIAKRWTSKSLKELPPCIKMICS
jgi:hypothetical protein